jgi:hypothetical protein
LQCSVLAVLLTAGAAQAVPAFARQTGFSCAQCHTLFPELTPFGRSFKIGAYTMSTNKQITEGGTEEKALKLELPAYVPLGAMVQVGFTHVADAAAVTGSTTALNDNIAFPQTFSLFYAGKISNKMGAFVELAYDGVAGTFGEDNTDIRFAHQIDLDGTPLTIGATLNNSPTVSDIYNSTPVWGFPALGSGYAPGPRGVTLVEESIAQQVAGLGLYASWNGMVYGEFSLYHAAPQRVELPLDHKTGASNIVKGVAPYWRLALEKSFGDHNIEIGTFGLHGKLLPGGTHELTGGEGESPTNTYTDIAVDAQYQWITDKHIISGTLTYINEGQWLDASQSFGESTNVHNDLHVFKASVNYIYDRLVAARLTLATVRGSSDAVLGGSPKSTSVTVDLFANPWLNTRFGVQYVAYLDLDGKTGSDASGANTFYAYAWLAY